MPVEELEKDIQMSVGSSNFGSQVTPSVNKIVKLNF